MTVIGAGIGGLNVALMLKRAGIPYTVIEKNAGVGGTWYENRYPGRAGRHAEPRLHPHLRRRTSRTPSPFCDWAENQRYFDWVADDVRPARRHRVRHRGARADLGRGDRRCGRSRSRARTGRSAVRSNAVITAVGFLNRPKIPEIEGMADFRGPSWHTARWPEDVDLDGQAGRGDRHRLHRLPADPGARARRPSTSSRSSGRRSGCSACRATCSPFPPQVTWLDRNLPYHTNFMRLADARHRQGVLAADGDRPGLRRPAHRQRAQQDDARRVARVPRAQARRIARTWWRR